MNLSHLLAYIAIVYGTVIDLKTLREMTGAVIFLKTKCGHLTTQKSINRIQEEAILTAICEGEYSKLKGRKSKKFCGLKCNALQNVTNRQNETFVNFCLRDAEVKNTIDKLKSNPNIFALLKKDLTDQLFESCTLSNLRVSPEAYSQIQSIFSTTGNYQDLRKYYNYACRFKEKGLEQGAMKTLKFIAKTLKDFYSYSNRFTDVVITIHKNLSDKNDTKAVDTKLKYYTSAIDLLISSCEYITDKVQFHDCNSNFRDDYRKCIDQIFDAADQLQGPSKKLSVCINMRAVFDLWIIFENILVHLNHFRNISRGNYIKYTYNPYTRAPHKFCISEVSFSEFPICKNIASFSKINTNNKPLVQKQIEWFDHMHYMYQLSRPASFEEYREICSTFIDRLFTHENEYTKDLTFILLSVLYRRNIVSAGNLSK